MHAAYGQADRSPEDRSSKATSLMTAQFGQKNNSNSPSIRLQVAAPGAPQAAQANGIAELAVPDLQREASLPQYEDAEPLHDGKLAETERQKNEQLTKRKVSLLMNKERWEKQQKSH